MININQIEMIAAVLTELSEQDFNLIDQKSMNAIVRNVDSLIKELDEITKEDEQNTDTK